jgi:mono/diheme cytochrome c family protein
MGKPAGRLLTLALVITALSLSLAACAPASAPVAPAAESVATTAPAATATSAPQPTAAPAATATAAPQPTEKPAATATQAPAATATSAPKPTDKPTATATQASAAAQPAGVSFAKDVLPIFQQNCIKCHGGEKTEALLSLKDHAGLTAGSENGPVVKPGNAADSELVKLVAQGKMPKRANRLSDSQIKTLTDWVNAGAPNN